MIFAILALLLVTSWPAHADILASRHEYNRHEAWETWRLTEQPNPWSLRYYSPRQNRIVDPVETPEGDDE